MRRTLSSLAILCALGLTSFTFADVTGKPITLRNKAIRVTNAQIMRQAAMTKQRPFTEPKRNEEETDFGKEPNHPASPAVSSWPVQPNETLRPRSKGSGLEIGPLFSVQSIIEGQTINESGYVPPDTIGDVGPRDVLISVNGRLRSYNRNGTVGNLNADANTFFNSVRNGANVVDPRVIYDRITQRWFLAEITTTLVAGSNLITLAVSDGPNIDPTTVWSFFQFDQSIGSGPAGFADYETLGVDANALYIGSNRFTNGTTFANCDMFVVRKSDLLAGTLTVTPFRNLIGGGAGMFTPWGCTNDDPAATVGLIVGTSSSSGGSIKARRITSPGGTPSLGAETNIIVPTTSSPPSMPISTSATTTGTVAALDTRLFYARIFKDRQTGVQTVWTAHGIGVDSAGVATTTNARAAGRWYQFGNPFSGSINLIQAGTAFDASATSPRFCTIPSVAMNGQGHALIGFSIGNLTNSPGIGAAYRLASDPLGATGAPFLVKAGVNYYNAQSGTTNKRWGDYSATVLDTRDGMSLWTFQEYVGANNVWRVAAVKLIAPAPTVTGVSPATVRQGDTNVNFTLTGTGLFDPDNTYPDHIAAAIPSGFTINSITWNGPTQVTVNASVAFTAPLGSRTVTVTNPDGQVATNAGLSVLPSIKTITGNLALQGWTGSISGLNFVAELRDATTNTLIETVNINGLATGNAFSFTSTQPAGNYRLRIKGVSRFLAKSTVVTVGNTGANGLNISLLNGDINGDNSVGGADFNLLRNAWGTTTTGPEDLNGDGSVGGLDFNILRNSWGQIGDN
jgi:hypothetical protein